MTLAFVSLCVAAYLVGAIPFGKWVASAHGVDIMALGSGNIGATNVWRTLGWRAGMPVFLFDAMKGYVPAFVAGNEFILFGSGVNFLPLRALTVGAFAVLGHSASVFLGFRGGKSVATALGVLLAVSPDAAGMSFAVFVAVFAATRYVSVGSIAGVCSAPVFAALLRYPFAIVIAYIVLASLIVYRHKGNISRLLRGEENRFGSSKESKRSDDQDS